jgi:hypothetical protein
MDKNAHPCSASFLASTSPALLLHFSKPVSPHLAFIIFFYHQNEHPREVFHPHNPIRAAAWAFGGECYDTSRVKGKVVKGKSVSVRRDVFRVAQCFFVIACCANEFLY